jgi:hypothetical protein
MASRSSAVVCVDPQTPSVAGTVEVMPSARSKAPTAPGPRRVQRLSAALSRLSSIIGTARLCSSGVSDLPAACACPRRVARMSTFRVLAVFSVTPGLN